MRGTLLLGSNSSSKIGKMAIKKIEKSLLTWRQFAWINICPVKTGRLFVDLPAGAAACKSSSPANAGRQLPRQAVSETACILRLQQLWLLKFIHQRLYVECPSQKIIKSTFSRLSYTNNINITKQTLRKNKEIFYQWLVGFTDGDGTFSIAHQNGKWSLAFKLSQHEYNMRLLYFIKRQLKVGNINKETKASGSNMFNYRIRDRKTLAESIFPIFDKYPLLTSKYFYYLKFNQKSLK